MVIDVIAPPSRGRKIAVAFERDRWRDRELLRAGYTVLRVTHHQAETEAAAIADTIAVRLGGPR